MITKAIFFILDISVAFIIGFITALLYFKRREKKPLGALQGEMLDTTSLLHKNEAEREVLKQKLVKNKKVVSFQNNSETSDTGIHLQEEMNNFSVKEPEIQKNYKNLIEENEAIMVKIEDLRKALEKCKSTKQQSLFFTDANPTKKDDLKLISGIGPFIEQKLNKIGIYNFSQIGSFDKPLIDKVTNAIEFFPGRIERDNWVGQAKILDKAKEKA